MKEQGINQWQTGNPDINTVNQDIEKSKGYFVVDGEEIYGYLCIDFDEEPAYNNLNRSWNTSDKYVVVHRMAFNDKSRGKGLASIVFNLVEKLSNEKRINSFRIDTDADNTKMQHVLKKNGFVFCGTIVFDNSEKIAFDKMF